jgi:hypothetical protein
LKKNPNNPKGGRKGGTKQWKREETENILEIVVLNANKFILIFTLYINNLITSTKTKIFNYMLSKMTPF